MRPTVQKVLDALDVPGFVQNSRLEIVAANALGEALYADAEGDHRLTLPFSMPHFVFLDPRSPDFYGDWSRVARNQVALLRTRAGRTPDDPELLALIGKLSTQSPHFRELWATHDVLKYRKGPKNYHHPVVGDVEFIGESFDLSEDEDLALLTYTYAAELPDGPGDDPSGQLDQPGRSRRHARAQSAAQVRAATSTSRALWSLPVTVSNP